MKRFFPVFTIIVFIIVTSFTAKPNDEVTNYYGIPEAINFNDLTFNLSWSSHPDETYYKQEYIPKGNTADHFNDMVMIDFIITDLPVQKAVATQIEIIRERKKTDAVCNYSVLRDNSNPGNYILDFVMSASKNGEMNLIEWNAYHYKPYTDKAGHKGVLLFGISHRAYENNARGFLESLGEYRHKNMAQLIKYDVPEIQIK
jgi:hypothetical protein